MYLLLVAWSLWCCSGFSVVAVRRPSSLVVVLGLLMAMAPFVGEHGLKGLLASVVAMCGL